MGRPSGEKPAGTDAGGMADGVAVHGEGPVPVLDGIGRVPGDAAGEGLVREGGEGRHGRHDEIVGLERVVEGGLELG